MGRAEACPRMRALPLPLPCLKHLTFLQKRVTFLLPTAPPQSQLSVKQRLKKIRASARYRELIAVRKPSEMHGEPQTGTHSSLPPPPMAGPMVPADSGGTQDWELKKCLTRELVGIRGSDGSRLNLPTSSGKGCTVQRGAYSHSACPPTFPLGSKL